MTIRDIIFIFIIDIINIIIYDQRYKFLYIYIVNIEKKI